MQKYLGILKLSPLFDGVSEDNLLKMLKCLGAKVESFDRKYTIFSEGAPVENIGVVLSGAVQVEQTDYYGNRSILERVEVGQVFAEEFACAGLSAVPVSVVTEDPCEVMFINSSHIIHTCANSCEFHQRLIYNLMKDLAEQNIVYHKKIEITSKRSTREKLMTYLLQQAKRVGSNSFDIPFDRQALADYLEVERSGLSVEIGKLKAEGVIDNYKNSFLLK